MSAILKDNHGTPTLYLNGKPVFYGLMWGSAPSPDDYPLKECARYYGQAGVHFFTFDMGMQGNPPDWCGPRSGSVNFYNFDVLQKKFDEVIKADPEAHFHLRVHLEALEWWQKLYPDECELTADGRRPTQSFASKVWREQAKDYLRALIAYINKNGMAERVVAYQTGAGGTGEWVKGSAMKDDAIDYSRPMQEHFRDWLRNRYNNDEKSLRDAWNDPYITFEAASVPPAAPRDGAGSRGRRRRRG